MKYAVEGLFNTGEAYSEEFHDKESFTYTMKKVLNNPCCNAPTRLVTKQTMEKLPKYLKEAAREYHWVIDPVSFKYED